MQYARYILALMAIGHAAFLTIGIGGNDYALKWYELYPVLVMYGVKVSGEVCYSCGPVPNRKEETQLEMMQILRARFGHDISTVVMEYLPLFSSTKTIELSVRSTTRTVD